MSAIYLIVAFGVVAGLLAVLAVAAFEWLRTRVGLNDKGPLVPKTVVGGLGFGNIIGPQEMLARAGQNKPTRMTLNTVIMTPTIGARFLSIGPSSLILFLLWTPMGTHLVSGLLFQLIITAAIGYAVVFMTAYEARYDADGITVPNWLFQDVHHSWEKFVLIKDDGHHLYKLKFESGNVSLQKYLVGMPTFLTFITDVREMNKGHNARTSRS